MTDFSWEPMDWAIRWDYGFGNPNKAAVFWIEAAFLSWMPYACFPRRSWIYWMGMLGMTASLIALATTGSRGALVAFFMGLVPFLWGMRKLLVGRRAAFFAGGLLLSMGMFLFFSLGDRLSETYDKGAGDGSIQGRLRVWRTVPAMVLAGPDGWEDPGEAYAQWFQPESYEYAYKNLVSEHLTQMVRLGLTWGIVYMAIGFVALLLAWPNSNRAWEASLAAIVYGYVGAGIFSFLSDRWILVVMPAIGLAVLACIRLVRERNRAAVCCAAGVAVAAVLGWMASSYLKSLDAPLVRHSEGTTKLGFDESTTREICLVNPDVAVLGRFYGREVQRWQEINPDWSIAVKEGKFDPRERHALVIFSGKGPGEIFNGHGMGKGEGALLWLNPDRGSLEALMQVAGMYSNIMIVCGGINTDGLSVDSLMTIQKAYPTAHLVVEKQQAIFLIDWPQWIKICLNRSHDSSEINTQ